MNDIAYIVGSSPFGTLPFNAKETECIGLNVASIDYNTKYAIAGHEINMNEFKRAGLDNVIAVLPSFDAVPTTIKYTDYIKHSSPNEVYCLQEVSDDFIEEKIISAINNEDCEYPNFMTVLHLAIFYWIKKGYRKIELHKCNLDWLIAMHDETETLHKRITDYNATWVDTATKQQPYMIYHTEKMIRIALKHGIEIKWFRYEH